jgi:H/ACA ribonucleoprotein complex subunit 4
MNQLPYERIKREVVVKRQAEIDLRYGCNPLERTTEELLQYGVININKPRGPTSHQVSAYVKDILHVKKSGHSGTLDPNVTGVLLVAVGRATRVVQALLPTGKEYVGIMHVHKLVEPDVIRKVCNDFLGCIKQLPPKKSSVKRVLRTREIYYFEILEISEQDVLFRVGCEAGTYIRKLCFDIGQKIGVGAHMAELIRTRVGPFTVDTMCSLQDLTDAVHYWRTEKEDEKLRQMIQPVENAVAHLPKVWMLDSAINSICHGHSLALPGVSLYETGIVMNDVIAMLSMKNELVALGIAEMSADEMKAEKGIAVKTDKVFMLPEVYPRMDKI